MNLMTETLKRIDLRQPPPQEPPLLQAEAAAVVPDAPAVEQVPSDLRLQQSTVDDQIESIQRLLAITTDSAAAWGSTVDSHLESISGRFTEKLTEEATEESPALPPQEVASTQLEALLEDISAVANSRPAIDVDAPYATIARELVRTLAIDRANVLAFTSPGRDQGTTTVVHNVARCLTELSAQSVLIVDGNFANADLSRRNAGEVPIELGKAFGGDGFTGGHAWRSAVQTTDNPRLSVLPIALSNNAALAAELWRGLPIILKELASSFGLLMIDAGSLADVRSLDLAAFCEATYLVVRLGQTSERMLRESMRLLKRRQVRVAGTVAIG